MNSMRRLTLYSMAEKEKIKYNWLQLNQFFLYYEYKQEVIMEFDFMKKTFLNKEVQIYPGDTHDKFGIVKDINQAGVIFKITKSEAYDFKPGTLRFIAWSHNLNFTLVENKSQRYEDD